MSARLVFPIITLFWVTMNVLLWRAEFGGGNEPGSPVSAEVVWEKMLDAPDDSTLEISWNGKKIGYCRWVPSIDEESARGKTTAGKINLEGRIRRVSGYVIDVEGNVVVGQPATRMRFTARLRFSSDHTWQEVSLRAVHRPVSFEIHSAAVDKTLSLKYEGSDDKWSRTFTYEELSHPQTLLEEFAGPAASVLLSFVSGTPAADSLRNMKSGLNWEARSDTLKIGHASVKVYRLQARLLDRYQAIVTISRSGELMRVDLPDGIRLANEALTGL